MLRQTTGCLLLSILATALSPGFAADSLRVGAFDVDASPPVGSPLAYDPTREVTTPLSCRGIVLLGTEAPIVLCAVDWIGIANDGQRIFREQLAMAAGTTPERVAVHTLHQHDAPRCDFSTVALAAEHGVDRTPFDVAFARDVIQRAAKEVERAVQEARPATHIGLGTGRIEQVASNRRILGDDGKVRHVRWTAMKDPAIRAFPEGVVDPLLRMISFWDGEQPLVVLTWYATHPQSYYRTGQANPDFPGLARNARQRTTGIPHVHFNGAGGNIGAGKYNDGSPENRQVLADRMDAGMRQAWDDTRRLPIAPGDVRWDAAPVVLPPAEHLDEAALLAELQDADRPAASRVSAASRLIWLRRCRSGEPIDVGCLHLGPARVLHLPGELFVEYQLAAQALRPDLFVALAAYGEYAPGYIGTAIAYQQGGYETSPGASLVAPGVETVLMDAIRRLLDAGDAAPQALGVAAAAREVSAARTAEEPPLRIGVAEADITPPEGFPMAGYYHERLATGTHDPLKARAIVFRDDQETAALVVCDLTGIAVDLSTEVRRRASERTGIPPGRIIVSATHSHTAPDYTRDLYEYLGEAARKDNAPPRYAERLIEGIVGAIARAHESAIPVVLDAGTRPQGVPVAFNRRFVMRDGSVRTWMRLDDPEVVRAAGPIDPEAGVVVVRSHADETPLAAITNFALHLDTVGGTRWSADYPYHIEQALRKRLGPDVVSVFGTGCCGDINHVDPSRRERNSTEFIGDALSANIAAALTELTRLDRPRLRVASTGVMLPLQEVAPADLPRATEFLRTARAGGRVDFFDLVGAYKAVLLDQLRNPTPAVLAADHINWGLTRTWAGVGDHLPVEVHVIGLGADLAIVCLPGEVFVDLGLAIKRASPFRTTLVIELSNCVETVYVPTRAAYAGGGYEVANSMLQPGSGEMLVEAALRLLREAAQHPAP